MSKPTEIVKLSYQAVQSHYQVCKANGSPMPNPSIVLEEVQGELNELALYLKTETFWYAEKFWKVRSPYTLFTMLSD